MPRRTRSKKEKGQALILVIVALSLFLIAGIGLAIDASGLFAQRQLAQNAADASALAAIMSLYGGTNNGFGVIPGGGGNPPSTDCSANGKSTLTPCYYASLNGFTAAAGGDSVKVDYWNQANAFTKEPGVSFSTSAQDPVPLLRVTVIRPVPTTLMSWLGSKTTNVAAQATAAVVSTIALIPILVLHPTLSGAFSTNGNGGVNKITICGGPKKSIQVNSCAGTGSSIGKPAGGNASCDAGSSFSQSGPGKIDLTKAGPNDPGGCTCANNCGGDFGNFGLPLPPAPNTILLGANGAYLDPASPIPDPLLNVAEPTNNPARPQRLGPVCSGIAAGTPCGTVTCPAADVTQVPVNKCDIYFPGEYPNGISLSGNANGPYDVFAPGVYYITSGGVNFNQNSTGQSQYVASIVNNQVVSPACGANSDADTGCGVMFFFAANGNNTNTLTVKANAGNLFFLGADQAKKYQGILFFMDRTATVSQNMNFSGGGTFSLFGTIYATHTVNGILNSISAQNPDGIYQTFSFGGNSGNGTVNGEIIVDAINLGGTPNITMNLDPNKKITRQVALVR